ncbi:flippase [Parasphingorhabdus sp. DH2-15]|uniref:flippase n=1 Tax=Parasphingorhabdus sp. DH2-15 TaxID=3444112 RepID=UPI003F6824DE
MSIGRNTAYNFAGSVTPLFLALATIPLYISLIGAERYGALAIAWLILGYFGLFDMGLGRAVAQRIAKLVDSDAQHRATVFWTAIVVNLALGLIGGVLLFIGAEYFFSEKFLAPPWLKDEVLSALPLLALAVPIATLRGVCAGSLQGREKFLDINIITILATCLFQILPLLTAYLNGPDLFWLVLAAIIARVIGLVSFYRRVQTVLLRGMAIRFDGAEWKILLKFGIWVTVVSIIGPLLVVFDRFAIGAMIGAVAVAVYTVPFEIIQRISILPRSVGMALFPKLAQLQDEEGVKLAGRATNVITFIVTPVIFAALFLFDPFLQIWIGPDIATQVRSVSIILLLAYWINAFAVIPYARLQASGRPHIVTLILLAQLPFYFAALYYAILYFGLVGAASVFSARTAIDYMLLNRFSTGKWVSTGFVMLSGILLVICAGAIFLLATFSLVWIIVFCISLMLMIILLLRNVPQEFAAIIERFLPPFIAQKLRFV